MAKTYPPIYSADNMPLEEGQKIYYVEKCCNDDNPYQIKEGTITEIVLTAARTVRVRKEKGREVVLSMSSRGGLCQTEGLDENLIFQNKKAAIVLATELSQKHLDVLEEALADHIQEREEILQEEADERRRKKTWVENYIENAKEAIKEYKEKLSNIGK